MAQRYPMVKPWLEYHRVSDGEYEIENEIVPGEIDEEPLRLPDYNCHNGWYGHDVTIKRDENVIYHKKI